MLKKKFKKKLANKPSKLSALRKKFLAMKAKKVSVDPLKKRFKDLEGISEFHNRNFIHCKKMGVVNADQCYLCFTNKMAKQDFDSRPICKVANVTLDEAEEARKVIRKAEREEKARKMKSRLAKVSLRKLKLRKIRKKKSQK